MSTVIKNMFLLSGRDPKQLLKMEQGALLHRNYSNISFKIVEYKNKKLTIQAVQGKSAAENYFNQKRLIEIVHETFDKFFPDHKIVVHAITYNEPPANNVDADWINKKMLEFGIKAKDIADETGINRSQITSLVTDNKPLSQSMKAMFWFYFKSKEIPLRQTNY